LERLLLKECYQVLALSSAVEAAELLPRFAPHMAVLDLGMPVMDGFALCKLLRQGSEGRRMHIVALSGRDYTNAEVKEAGFDRLFLKPLDWLTLKVELARVVAKREI
ncbi:MAG TPA: response regulator, partial [Burkholderiales bacterium]|nr:response regulator [Burkholderiales bacterium]